MELPPPNIVYKIVVISDAMNCIFAPHFKNQCSEEQILYPEIGPQTLSLDKN